ncbi:MAG TPA: hypothetical protein VK870_01800 [Ignavibacteriaceae bacterium]|nr:hypothetical protein [Ignavibacteriaceae bacterium]
MRNFKNIILAAAICIVIPAAFNFISYYGYVSTYPAKTFDLESFNENLGYGVYQHRVLGKAILLYLNEIVASINFPQNINTFNRIREFLEVDSLSLYHSFFILNTLFLCCTAFVLYFIYNLRWVRLSEMEKILSILTITAIISLSQFVILPYDVLSYFFISLAVLLLLVKKNIFTTLLLAAVVVLGALTRETITLIFPLYFVILLKKDEWKFHVNRTEFFVLLIIFAAIYLTLRVIYGFESSFSGRILFPDNIISPQNLIGFLFMICTSLIFLFNEQTKKPALIFLILSAPYFFLILMTGIMFEIRLFVPVFILLMIIMMISRSKSGVLDNDEVIKKESIQTPL